MFFWQGDKIRLRAVEPRDAEYFYTWSKDSEMWRRYDFLEPSLSLEAAKQWAVEQSLKKLDGDTYHWMIETLDGTPVGSIGTHHSNARNGTFSYGITIAAEQRGRGYAREAIWLVLRYYFEELRYQKVIAGVYSFNTPSIRLHQSLGFTPEGVWRRMIYSMGAYHDLLWFGMTVEEWQTMERTRAQAA